MLRVVAGTAKGLKLKTPEGNSTRPTRDMVKESIFSMIAQDIEGSLVLDMFSGSGSLGIEALSRGAEKAVFFDSNRTCCDIIKENLSHTRLLEKATVVCTNVLNESNIRQTAGKFNLVFLDPPYGKGFIQEAVMALIKADMLLDDVLIIAEHGSDEDIPENIGGLGLIKRKKYGITSVSIYKFEERQDD